MDPRDIIVWTCVTLFVAVAIISLLNLIGLIKLPEPKHGNILFRVLIVEIIIVSVGFFATAIYEQNIKNVGNNQQATVSTKTSSCINGSFSDGECLPSANASNIDDRLKMKLYQRCLLNGGDEYTSNCCDHLSVELAQAQGVCGH